MQREDISATLGEDSLHQALIAGIGGLLAVAFFLLLFYRFLGVIAIIWPLELTACSSTARC